MGSITVHRNDILSGDNQGSMLVMATATTKKVDSFLNRLLGLPMPHQALIFNYYQACLDITIKQLKRSGEFEESVKEVGGKLSLPAHADKEGELIYKDESTGSEARLFLLDLDQGMTFGQAIRKLRYSVLVGSELPASVLPMSEEDMPLEDDISDEDLAVLMEAAENMRVGGWL